MNRIFVDRILATGEHFDLPAEAARHVAGALRLRVNDGLILFNGGGGEYAAVIEAVDRRRVAVRVHAHHDIERESPLAVTLAQGLSRGERMDFSVQKAVELGVRRIVPFQARRSNVRLSADRATKRLDHWRSIARHACEQCGRNRIPVVTPPVSLDQVLAGESYSACVALDPAGSDALPSLSSPDENVLLVIGPEGGFDDEELRELEAARCLRVRLGPRVLRTETATIAGLTMLQMHCGDFRGSA